MITKTSPAGRPGKVGKPGSNRRKSDLTAPRSQSQEVDVFAQAKDQFCHQCDEWEGGGE
jgi:hypothetical protein